MQTIDNTPVKTTHITKAAYQAFVTEWKSEYRVVAEGQRTLKKDLKVAQREGNYGSVLSCQWGIATGKKRATALLEKRAAMKAEAQAAYLASKTAAALK